MNDLRNFPALNAGYVLDLYERWRRDPAAVDPSWHAFFAHLAPGDTVAAVAPAAPSADWPKLFAAVRLAEAIRTRGHLAADLNPLAPPPPEPSLRPEAYGLTEADLERLPAHLVGGPVAEGAAHAGEAIARLRAVYCGPLGFEFAHLDDDDQRRWWQDAVESGRFWPPLDPELGRRLLRRLTQVEAFERYLHRAFFGQKRFSIEGTDTLVPLLDEVVAMAAAQGAEEVRLGMAHRGRLNVLAHLLDKPYEKILEGFLEPNPEGVADAPDDFSGDVKYHLGWETERASDGRRVRLRLAPNPSHLEAIDPVLLGMTRAAQSRTDRAGAPEVDPRRAVAVLVHGDASFPAQGIVAETLNLMALPAYRVGGTIHILANNQIGFTTEPWEGRSTRYASDLAKGFGIPVVHVNADEPLACLTAARLAVAYRAAFGRDVVIDLVGYRRWGHNEGDDPSFTQPTLYERIAAHPTVRQRWAERLVEAGALAPEEPDRWLEEALAAMAEAHRRAEATGPSAPEDGNGRRRVEEPATAVPRERLQELNDALLAWPPGFAAHPRLARVLERRREAFDRGEIDWGHAEALAFASLLADGVPVRLTGQDSERGTFSHRHAVLHDVRTGERLVPLQRLPHARASFEIANSPLSEAAVLGFEYGFSVAAPEALVLWEAQFGDFANGAQVIIDQFLASARAKWGQRSGVVLLLPHGYEGQGPEHSSARVERFLQLAAEGNLRIANCTTAAQYFHLLRRQALLLAVDPRPLVLFTPKSLLRHPRALARAEELAHGRFRPVLIDAEAPEDVTRLILCSGKVYVDLVEAEGRSPYAAVARLEELYPFPQAALEALLPRLPQLQEVVWVQEEPRNMGAWRYVEPRLRALFGEVPVRYVGRPERASPAEGSLARHKAEQARLVREAWADVPTPARA